MLMSSEGFLRIGKDKDVSSIQCDVLVLDEAHTMLKNSKNKVFKALSAIETPRKIGEYSELSPHVYLVCYIPYYLPISRSYYYHSADWLSVSKVSNHIYAWKEE